MSSTYRSKAEPTHVHLTKLGSTELKLREGLYYWSSAKKASGSFETSPGQAMVTVAGSIISWEQVDGPSP